MTAWSDPVAETVDAMLVEQSGPDAQRAIDDDWAPDLWHRLEDLGMTAIDVSDAFGGGDGNLTDAVTVAKVCGYHSAPIPIVESGLVGAWLRGRMGLDAGAGPYIPVLADLAAIQVEESPQGVLLTGEVRFVAWGRTGAQLVVVADRPNGSTRVAAVDPCGPGVSWRRATNVAGEPRDTVVLTRAPLSGLIEIDGLHVDDVRNRLSLGRAALMVGALQRVLASSIEHVQVREQFGRPLSSFQVIAHYVAQMAAEVAAAQAALAGILDEEGAIDVLSLAAARVRIGMASQVLSNLGHQVHGAMGVSDEHALGLSTRRLWAWRDEDGDEQFWARLLARSLAERPGSSLWEKFQPAIAAEPEGNDTEEAH